MRIAARLNARLCLRTQSPLNPTLPRIGTSAIYKRLSSMTSGPGPSRPIPLILCGKTEQIGRGVIEGLKPEYEVVRFIMTPEAGQTEIPALLSTNPRTLPPPSSSLGTNNSDAKPNAVILGGAFGDKDIASMRDACYSRATTNATLGNEDGCTSRRVPWLRPDLGRPAPPVGPEYGKAMVARVREALERLQKENKLEGNDDVVWF